MRKTTATLISDSYQKINPYGFYYIPIATVTLPHGNRLDLNIQPTAKRTAKKQQQDLTKIPCAHVKTCSFRLVNLQPSTPAKLDKST